MSDASSAALCGAIRECACPITGSPRDYDELADWVGDARLVLLGEASHGTHEFYRERGLITRRLIERKGFNAVAAEADWPDAWQINEYVRGEGDSAHPGKALEAFRRFPNWMWRNQDVLEFVEWLRVHNDALAPEKRAGFYGLDLYSMYASMQEVVRYLEKTDTLAARRARYRYSCFEHFQEDSEAYGYAVGFDLESSCEQQVVAQLIEMQKRAAELARRDGHAALDTLFYAAQNARVVKNAEEYYRNLFGNRMSTWNLRDRHMTDTLDELLAHLEQRFGGSKVVVWAHNSHLGDARATEMAERGELNIGQLVRERYGDAAVLVGFTTYDGSVTAADEWGGAAENMRVKPALEGSYEQLFHGVGLPQFSLIFRSNARTAAELRGRRLERAIGVIYRPRTERLSHYLQATMADQFDAVLHFDRTRAVEPLERTSEWDRAAEPETFPSGL